MNRQQILLAIVACLVVIRFVLFPGFEYLQELQAEVDTLNARYQKGENMLSSAEQLDARLNQVTQLLSAQKAEFPTYSDQKTATLNIQKKLDDLAKKHDVTFENQEWVRHSSELPRTSTMELKVEAKLEDYVRFQLELEALGDGVTTNAMSIQIKKQILRQKRLGTVSGSIAYQFYYVVEDSNG